MSSRVIPRNAEVGPLPSVTKAGYTFAGWFTTSSGVGNPTRPDSRFTVSATLHAVWRSNVGINVTVVDGSGNPISGAYVHFLRAGNISRTYRTGSDGVAIFPNAPAGRYGINVTHPRYASTPQTSTPLERYIRGHRPDGNPIWADRPAFVRDNTNQVQHVSFTMTELRSTFRNFDPSWVDVLPDMHIQSNHRVSFIFGWRYMGSGFGWHNGIDLVSNVHPNAGRQILSAFDGVVVQVFPNNSYAGYGANVRFDDEDNGAFYFLRYMHMERHPQISGRNLARWDELYAGQAFGRVGNTGDSFGAHLHIDIHRQDTPDWLGRNVDNIIDPRAFFSSNFANPWNINIQP